jgi:hypothetical protein
MDHFVQEFAPTMRAAHRLGASAGQPMPQKHRRRSSRDACCLVRITHAWITEK